MLIANEDQDIQIYSLWVLGNLSCSEKAQELICQSGILGFLVNALSSDSGDIVYRGTLCLGNLLLSDKNKEKILNDAEKIFPLVIQNLSFQNQDILTESIR